MTRKFYLLLFSVVIVLALFLLTRDEIAFAVLGPLLPPLVAIGTALITSRVILSLFAGVWCGVFLKTFALPNPETLTLNIDKYPGFIQSAFRSLFSICDTYLINALTDSEHACILVFTIAIAGMAGVIIRTGGLGITEKLKNLANSRSSCQLYTWMLGLAIFFDDYASSLLVGYIIKPLSDKFRISREKLSFLVDSMSSPVTSICLVTTWLGYQVSLITDSFHETGIELDPYTSFISSTPFAFYPLLTVFFVFLIAVSGRDFGPMYLAEKRAVSTGQLYERTSRPLSADLEEMPSDPGIHSNWLNFALPVLVLLLSTVFGLYLNGYGALPSGAHLLKRSSLQWIISNGSPLIVLIWSSVLASLSSILLALYQNQLPYTEIADAWLKGAKSMASTVLILLLSWSLCEICGELHTSRYLAQYGAIYLLPAIFPFFTFVLACLISFATGTSWGTMAILYPLAIPLAHRISLGEPVYLSVIHGTIGAVIAGSVFGDHASPVSDTTILSSASSGCDLMDHVRTQLPYAFVVAAVSGIIGFLGTGLGISPWILLITGMLTLTGIIFHFGLKTSD
ncbi:MAG: Na+/H+ antiporter NhaC family protein [Candidatus Wallbacteria bacterium]|nr:Na+/H+ antiporter NhaC family protein [Candidatus Wallbacteria bacterium]